MNETTQGLDMPDGPGWWAWTWGETKGVTEVYVGSHDELIADEEPGGCTVDYYAGRKWYRLSMPWETPPAAHRLTVGGGKMNKHWQYLKYVLRHKWYVFLWCCRYGIPVAGIFHDLSKFRPREWFPYVDFFYGGPYPEANHGDMRNWFGDVGTKAWAQQRFDAAWNHHQKSNSHHWQYWILHEDSGKMGCIPMPDRYRREMLADWRGAGMAINGKDETRDWYLENSENMLLHPDTRHWVEVQLGVLFAINGVEMSLVDLRRGFANKEEPR